MRHASLFMVFLALGCGTSQPPDNADTGGAVDGGDVDAGTETDAWVVPHVDANVDAYREPHDAGYADGGEGDPITGTMETWHGVTIDDARCGNGSPLVVGVNLTNRSTDVVIYFQGGGACWNSLTCFSVGTATHVSDTLTEADVVNEATQGTSFFFERNAMNPFQNASYVYIPYCTGDAHAGRNVVMLGTHEMHFEGGHNAERVLARAHATWPTTTHVTLIGASAGGYGVVANWQTAQDTFTGARVDALSDCGDPVDMPAGQWRTVRTAWGFDFPEQCVGCDSIGDALPYYATAMPLPHRFGLIAFLDDSVIPNFYAESMSTLHAQLVALRPVMDATPNQRSYFSGDMGHVVSTTPDAPVAGVTVRQWVTQFATDDPAWADVGP